MSIYDVPNMSNGIDELLVGTVTEVSSFTPMFLLFVFLTVLIGGAVNQKRRSGTVDLPMWSVMASISTLVVSLILTLKSGLIQMEVLSIVVVITIFSGMWLFFDRNRNEI